MNKGKKPYPDDVAQVCRNGHVITVSVNRYLRGAKPFCPDCGAATIEQCPTCDWPIEGCGPNAWMAGTGPYQPPKYCGECGNPFPWTETALAAAREYADEIEQLDPAEKDELK